MKECLLVGVGGMFGSIARYLCGNYLLYFAPDAKFPWGTFTVNLLGCLLIGLFAGLIEKMSGYGPEVKLICISGFLGGFTTFSAFGFESLNLLKEGDSILAISYIALSVVSGLLLAYAGLKAAAFILSIG